MDYAQFLFAQESALVEQYFAAMNIAWIGTPDRGWLSRRQSLDGGQVVAMPGFADAQALVWRDVRGRHELWVQPEEKAEAGTGLYGRAWRAFVRLFGDSVARGELGGRKLAVDHLFPETAGSRLGLGFVRVMAVDRRANSLLGSTVETAAANGKPGSLRPRFAKAVTLAKVSGFQGSFARRHASGDVARALFDHMRARGYPMPAGALAQLEIDNIAADIDWYRGDR